MAPADDPRSAPASACKLRWSASSNVAAPVLSWRCRVAEPTGTILQLVRHLVQLARAGIKEVVVEALVEQRGHTGNGRRLLNTDEHCEALGISRSKHDGLVAAGMPFVRVGATKRYLLDETIEWMRGHDEGRAA